MIDVEVREGVTLRLHLVQFVEIRVARAHDILGEHVDAVVQVHVPEVKMVQSVG
jgi:hypothetical protein